MSTSVPSGRRPKRASLDTVGTELRPILLAFAVGVVLVLVVVLLSVTQSGSVIGLLGTLAAGLVLMLAAWQLPGFLLAPLDPAERANPARAASMLRSTGMTAMALAEVPVLIGVIVAYTSNGWLPALGGGVIAIAGLLVFGPTRGRLAAWKDKLESRGARTGL